MKWYDYLYAPVQWAFILAWNIVSTIVGIPVVAIIVWCGLTIGADSKSDGRRIITAPRWLWIFGNDYDGYLGDKREWWNDNADAQVFFGLFPFLRKYFPSIPVLKSGNRVSQWWWGAIRNPVNNDRFTPLLQAVVDGSVITYTGDYHVRDHAGEEGRQFVRAVSKRPWIRWYGFYWVHQWSDTHAWVVRLGFKINPAQNGLNDPPEGATFKITPYKAI